VPASLSGFRGEGKALKWSEARPYRRHLREGWPIVLSLIGALFLKYAGGVLFGYRLHLLDELLPGYNLDAWWDDLMLVAVGLLLLLYLSGCLTRWPALTAVILAALTVGNLLRVADLGLKPLPAQGASAGTNLIGEAATVWIGVILIFTAWYWLLESGHGPAGGGPAAGPRDFLFPQQANELLGYSAWRPRYLDYLFLAFCTGVAFSPADVSTLSHRAKVLQMTQAVISQALLVLVAARGINLMASSA
jgi:hypothetical protein